MLSSPRKATSPASLVVAGAGAVAAVAAVVVNYLAWQQPKAPVGDRAPTVVSASPPESKGPAEPVPQDTAQDAAPPHLPAGKLDEIAPPRTPDADYSLSRASGRAERPLVLSLSEGEQEVIMAGQVGVAVSFSEIDEIPLATLRINVAGTEPTNHAILGAGGRVGFQLSGKAHHVYILRIDHKHRTADLRVE